MSDFFYLLNTVFLLCFIVFREILNYKERNELTNKLMSKDYKEYSFSQMEAEREKTKRAQPPVKQENLKYI